MLTWPDRPGPVPVVATLVPDDPWRELVLRKPGLAVLRRHLATRPGADLERAAEDMVAANLLPRLDPARLRTLLG